MREFVKKGILSTIVVCASGQANSKECSQHIVSEHAGIRDSLKKISEDFVIHKEHTVGFQIIDKVVPNANQSARIYKLMKQTNTPHEVLQQVFAAISSLFDTHRLEDIVQVIEVAVANNMPPVALAKALSNIQKDLPLIQRRLGFQEDIASFEFTKADVQEALVIFGIASQRKNLSKETFLAEVDLIASELKATHAIDILTVLQISLQLNQDVLNTIEQIKRLQTRIVLEKRAIGFNVNPLNPVTVHPDIHTAITIVAIMKQTGLTEDKIVEGFNGYKTLNPQSTIEEFVLNLTYQMQQQQLRASKAPAQEPPVENVEDDNDL